MRDEKGYFWGEFGPPVIDDEVSLASIVFDSLNKCNSEAVAQIEVDTTRQLTYGELKRLCFSTASGLKSLGVKENSVVSVIANNSRECQVVVLAAVMLGATVSPVDPTLTPEAMAECLKRTRPKLIFSDGSEALDGVQAAIALVHLEALIVVSGDDRGFTSFQSLLKTFDPQFKPTIANPKEHVAFIQFTSGTSGLPKGVLLNDLYFTYNLHKHAKRGASYLSTSFMFWVSGIFISLRSLLNEMLLMFFRSPPQDDEILSAIHRYRPTTWFAQPTCLLRMLSMNRSDYDLTSLRFVLSSGEPLSSENALRVQREIFADRIPVIQIYGMTEAGSITSNSLELNKPGSSGLLNRGVCVKIENLDTKECLGPGKEGEICVKHPGLLKGYLDGSSGLDEDGWYRTGDVGFFDEDGHLFIVDRVKDLIQFRSYQIAPAEIENVLRAHPSVKEVAVFAMPNYEDHYHPAAYVVAETNVSEKDLHDFVAQRLPESKRLRGGIRFIDSIPTTRTGKISRRILRSMFMKEQIGS